MKFILIFIFSAILDDIFKICDIDGNNYLNKDEFKWYSVKTSEDEWEEDMWKELQGIIMKIIFQNFVNFIMVIKKYI